MPRTRAAERIGQIGAYGFAGSPALDAGPRRGPRRSTTRQRWAGGYRARSGGFRRRDPRTQLMAAGLYTTRRATSSATASSRLVFTDAVVWLATTRAPDRARARGIGLRVLAGGGADDRRAQPRGGGSSEIDYDLPELIDLLVVTVEAGSASALASGRAERARRPARRRAAPHAAGAEHGPRRTSR